MKGVFQGKERGQLWAAVDEQKGIKVSLPIGSGNVGGILDFDKNGQNQ